LVLSGRDFVEWKERAGAGAGVATKPGDNPWSKGVVKPEYDSRSEVFSQRGSSGPGRGYGPEFSKKL
jgi:hypothetical protein